MDGGQGRRDPGNDQQRSSPALFFPASLLIDDGHYLVFISLYGTSLYGTRIYALLAGALILVGLIPLLWLPRLGEYAAWVGGVILLVASVALFLDAKRDDSLTG